MRITTTISILLLLAISCTPKRSAEDYADFIERTFDIVAFVNRDGLTDTLATIKIKTPNNLDTFYKWTNNSDCFTCDRLQYRFADKNYVQFAESGFFWTFVPDSVYQLTFIHSPLIEIPDSLPLYSLPVSDTSKESGFMAQQAIWCKDWKTIRKDHKVLNKRSFIITAFTSECSTITKKHSLFVGATTYLKKMQLYILAETNSTDTTGFIDLMSKSLHSIEITEK